MLKGKSTLTLEHATIVEAVERYLRSGLVDGNRLKVDEIERQDGYGSAEARKFIVTVSEVAADFATI
jgi:hypothetical protein